MERLVSLTVEPRWMTGLPDSVAALFVLLPIVVAIFALIGVATLVSGGAS